MKENSPSISTLRDLLINDAGRFTSTEVELRNALPLWIGFASSLKLKTVLQKYLELVEMHIERMNSFFSDEQVSSVSISNRVIKAYVEDLLDRMKECADAEVKDACLLSGVQSVNHYKISLYGTGAAFANALGMEKHAALFHEAEVNEKQIDDRLSQLAEHEINIRARTPIVLPG
jgi:ferritin-like metal-binding protein YciE